MRPADARTRPRTGRFATARRRRQTAFWEARYAEDPAFFGSTPSPFAHWSLRWLRRRPDLRELVEIGCGTGRDARFFLDEGYSVRACDPSRRAVALSTEGFRRPPEIRSDRWSVVVAGDFHFLRGLRGDSVDVIYSNLVLNMDFTDAEHGRLLVAARRALRPRGLCLYSVRSTRDRWYGRGRRVGPLTYDLAPDGTTMHFFSPTYARRLAERAGFRVRRIAHRREGRGDFPIRVLYVLMERPDDAPRGPGAAPTAPEG